MGIVYKRIFNEGVQSRPFKAHKRYEVTHENYSSSFEISILRGIYDNGTLTEISTSVNDSIAVQPNLLTGSGAMTDELNSIPQEVVWHGINSPLFKYQKERTLYETASIVSIPQNKFGDYVKPSSVFITCSSADTTASYYRDVKVSDEYGIIVDETLDTSTFTNLGNSVVHIGFDRKSTNDLSSFDNKTIAGRLEFTSGPNVTGGLNNLPVGWAASSTNVSSSYVIRDKEHLNILNEYDDWAVSIWIKLPTNQQYVGSEINTIFAKRFSKYDANAEVEIAGNYPIYPFDLQVFNQSSAYNGQLLLEVSDGSNGIRIQSNTSVNDSQWHSVIVNKTGSNYELYVDGVNEGVSTNTSLRNINNDRDITIFSKMNKIADTITF